MLLNKISKNKKVQIKFARHRVKKDSPTKDYGTEINYVSINESEDDEEIDTSDMPKDIIEEGPQREDSRFYCTNKNLLREMFKWRNSSTNGLKIYKLTPKNRLIQTKIFPDTLELHEKYEEGVKYFVKYPKTHKRYSEWQEKIKKQEDKNTKLAKHNPQKIKEVERPIFYKETRYEVVEDVTKIVKNDGWCFDIDDPLDVKTGRVMSDAFGMMIMQIAQKISNHSYFRNYSLELKQDCQSYSYEKIIKGLFNYSFRFSNVFAYLSQACFNSFKSILSKHYKQVNIKRSMVKKAIVNLQSEIPGSAIDKSLSKQFDNNDYDGFTEF